MFPKQFHSWVYFTAVALLAVSLPYSVFAISVTAITLMVNWLLEGDFQQKWDILRNKRSLWILLVFYAVHLLWMVNTSDYEWGMHDLKIKLPMLIIPLVFATSNALSLSRIRAILNLYLASIIVASIICAYSIFRYHVNPTLGEKEFFPYVSHIRLSLMMVMAVFITPWLFRQTQHPIRWVYIPAGIWLICCLMLIQVLTGIAVLIAISTILLMRSAIQSRNLMLRWFIVVGVFTIVVLSCIYLINAYARFYNFDKIDIASLEKTTINGNPYWHDPSGKLVENGHFVNLYICDIELRNSWNQRSKVDYEGYTFNKGLVKLCLARYLTSKGLRKDSAGLSKLTDREIKYIENGTANYIDTVRYGLYPRIYVALWELYNYQNGANPTGGSISQRCEFIKIGLHIIQKHLWFGVGTGDIPDAFTNQYRLDNSPLAPENRLRTHNQFITFVITFGLIGFLLILCSLYLPPLLEKKYTNYLFLVILLIGTLSFLNEDTLETHQGVSFFAFFYSLFLFLPENDKT